MAQPLIILMIDDDEDEQRCVRRVLKPGNHVLLSASSAADGLAMVREKKPDLVLLDYRLPDLDGLAVLKQLADAFPFLPPVIVLTGQGNERVAVEAIQAGAFDYLVKDVKGNYLRLLPAVICRAHDASQERRRTRRLHELHEAILRTVADGILGIGGDGAIVFANPAAERMLGHPGGGLVGRQLAELLRQPGPQQGTWEGHPLFQAHGGAAKLEGECELLRPESGSTFPAAYNASALDFEDDGRIGWVLAFQDITDRKRGAEALRRSEEQLRQVQKLEAVGRLAGGVAHDFNNLLTAILGNAQAIAEQLNASDPLRTEAQEIETAAQQAAAVTRQLLTFCRRQAVSPRILNPAALVEGMDRTLRRLVGEQVEVTTVVHPGIGCVHADLAQLEQVLLNLVLNARDAMPTGGRLRLEIADVDAPEGEQGARLVIGRGPYVRIAVRDTGIGMTPEVQAHLFEPFFTTKEPGKGTGLGLATVYGIVRQAGGDVRVESAIGKGTSVEVYLPRRTEAPDERRAPPPIDAAGGSETVLLVEDERMVRALAARVLRRAGYTVLEASDGEEALSLVMDSKLAAVDLLLTDVVMPRLGGPELADRLRANRPEIPVLFASGYLERVADVHARLGRTTGFISKPFTPAELTRKVRELLDRRHGCGSA